MVEGLYSRSRYLEGKRKLNVKEMVNEFEREYREEEEEIRQQKQIKEEKNFDKELPEKYMAKLVLGWENRKYKREQERRWDKN